jgi:hypothetical protein
VSYPVEGIHLDYIRYPAHPSASNPMRWRCSTMKPDAFPGLPRGVGSDGGQTRWA